MVAFYDNDGDYNNILKDDGKMLIIPVSNDDNDSSNGNEIEMVTMIMAALKIAVIMNIYSCKQALDLLKVLLHRRQ